ncbi:peroxiredoxin-like family protein [Mycobacterium sp.]|uniref:peroxiredoxin-like family protein n=1 Tax=Mycobacterium sp. TaxID=1785 RepID=UPI003D126DBE
MHSTVRPGTVIQTRELTTISGDTLQIPDPQWLTHLQFRRFAGCPICNTHLQSIVARHDDIRAAGIREVVVFHSTPEELARYESDLPFAVVGDPGKVLYAEFGVESSARSVLDPRAMAPVIGPTIRSVPALVRKKTAPPPGRVHGGRLGLPGDFLIGPDGRVIAAKLGKHAYDQWSVTELLAHIP